MNRLTLAALPLLVLPAIGFARSAADSQPPLVPVVGLVREASGVPIPSALVELRLGTRRLASGQTDVTGAFELLPTGEWTEGWQIRVSRLGYEPLEAPVPAGVASLDLVMAPAPIAISGVQVDADRDFCSARDDRNAREIWRLATAHTQAGLDTVGIASYTQLRVDTVGAGSPGVPGMSGAEEGQRSSAPLLRLSWDRRVQREGYAFPVRRTDADASYDSWGYPPLEADFAPHFASESFGDLHTFHVDQESEDGWVLRFCGRRRDDPYLEGAIEIGPDTLIQKVEWHFRTEDPQEGAGGWAGFPPPSTTNDLQVLLPTESVTWRTLPGGEVVRRAQWYEGWITVQGDSVPFLPHRAESADPAR